MREHLHAFPAVCRRAWEQTAALALPASYRDIDNIVVLGMGGSAIGAEIARDLALAHSRVPIWVHRDYGLPPFVNGRTLVIASSYSGSTEETLSGFTAALEEPMPKLAVTSGGRLKELAGKNNIPVIPLRYRAPPRAAFPESFTALAAVFTQLGLMGRGAAEIPAAFKFIEKQAEQWRESTPVKTNPAKALAQRLYGKLPVVYGAEFLAGVTRRWKTQFNENARTAAYFEMFPELDHNAVCGYGLPAGANPDLHVLMLTSGLLNERNLRRYEVTQSLLKDAGICHEVVGGTGDTAPAQALGLVLLGDYVSYYLAMLNGIDPTPVPTIDKVKSYLTSFSSSR